jgi:hypothetical protein
MSIAMLRASPGRHPLGHALWTVITVDIPWNTMGTKHRLESLDDLLCRNRVSPGENQALTGILSEHRQALQPPAAC